MSQNSTINHDIIFQAEGSKGIVAGNDAMARGAFEAGVKLAAGYKMPIILDLLENFQKLGQKSQDPDLQMEWSINEKVAFEVALAGSMCNIRSLAVFRNVGVNVAADSFMTGCYAGAKGGLVCISVDDPGMRYLPTEQDNRYYGLHGLIPVFEPSNVRESKQMLKYAYDFSEKFETLVLFRTTSALHLDSGVITDEIPTKLEREYIFDEKQRHRWTHLPTNARVNRIKLLDRMKEIAEFAEEFPFNDMHDNSNAKIGIIASGRTYTLTKTIIEENNLDSIALFKLGLVHPLPEKKLGEFLAKYPEIYVVEELEPILEEGIKRIAYENHLKNNIHGKDTFPRTGSLDAPLLVKLLGKIVSKSLKSTLPSDESLLQDDLNNLRNSIKVSPIFTAFDSLNKAGTPLLIASDIASERFDVADVESKIHTNFTIGSSIGFANGIAKLEKKTIITLIGADQFYHTGVSGLINALYNENPMIALIHGESTLIYSDKVNLKKFVKGIGVPVTHILEYDPNDAENIAQQLKAAIELSAVKVLIPEDTQ